MGGKCGGTGARAAPKQAQGEGQEPLLPQMRPQVNTRM